MTVNMKMIKIRSLLKTYVRIFAPCKNSMVHFSTIRSSRQKWYRVEEIDGMSRKELQKWCKKLKLRANSKTSQMRSDLIDFHQGILSKSTILNYPFLPYKTPFISCANDTKHSWEDKQLMVHKYGTIIGPQTMVIDKLPVRYYMTGDNEDVGTIQDRVVNTKMNIIDKIPSVSAVLRSTLPKSNLFALLHWTKKQKHLLGEDNFRRRMTTIKKNGTEFHRFIHQCLTAGKLDTEVPKSIQGFVESIKEVFDKLGDITTSEHKVFHEHLGYKGKIDVLASYDGNPCIIEWKTSENKKGKLEKCGDYPLQVVAYAGAINDENLCGFDVKHGLVVVAYEDGSPADIHCLDLQLCQSLWQIWLLRLHQFYNQNTM